MMFLDNKSTRLYFKICANAESRQTQSEERYEKHHVIPKFLGGENHKTVKLTVREHYICHLLLTRMLEGKHRASAFWALKAFTMSANNTRQLRCNSRAVSLFRRAYENEEWRRERGQKISKARMQKDVNERISNAAKELWQNPAWREKTTATHKQLWATEEHRSKMGAVMSSDEVRDKISTRTAEAMQKPEVRQKYLERYTDAKEKRIDAIKSAWADPIKKAARLEKLAATRAKKLSANF
jgi:hypothetical protein